MLYITKEERLKAAEEYFSVYNWDESQHPRDKYGKFIYKGQDAINHMLKIRKGKIKNAFYRKDIGHIDLIWGDGSKGLSHIIKRREKDEKQDINSFLAELTNVIQQGQNLGLNEKGRYEIALNRIVAIIEPTITNGERTFLLTAYKERKK